MKDQATPLGSSDTPATIGRPADTGTEADPERPADTAAPRTTADPADDAPPATPDRTNAPDPAAATPKPATDPEAPATDPDDATPGAVASPADADPKEPVTDPATADEQPDGRGGWHPLLRVLVTLGVVAVLVGALVVVGLRYDVAGRLLNPDRAAGARIGDCLAALPDVADGGERRSAEARTVSCSSSEAAYDVVGRVDGQTEAQVREGRQCEPFVVAGGTYYTYSSIPDGGTGYLLCLVPRS
ncbi:LppU/SCO3897 family protein [Micromonospora cathayae]|uniref:Uncharacterized protein n=1 Tax=Micromonospora cathayae TaxID=3028804 RepID=A0ABY7ZYC2_9ACTN|nr:hypothetical protein [Micromonospora sp. HUAS 3]WDZ86879.1 hypothetical protein PVK37_11005 [Micromonospora sp. HUAS 3]